jgi:hypothetical protein
MMERFLVLLCALLLTGCSIGGGKENASPSSLTERPIAVVEGSSSSGKLEINDPWGIALTVKNVTPTGLTIICTQSGGKDVAELHSGSYFVVEQLHGEHWEACENIIEGEFAWTAEAWGIPQGDSVEWKTDWAWLHGELAPGTYRVGKEIDNFRGTGDFDTAVYYAEFTI